MRNARTDRANYLAGLFEGEGSGFICKGRGTYNSMLQLSMRTTKTLLYLKSYFGGSVSTYKANGIPMHKWYITGRKAGEIAEQLLPNVICPKKRKALICVIAFSETIGSNGTKTPTPMLDLRKEIYDRCHEVNISYDW